MRSILLSFLGFVFCLPLWSQSEWGLSYQVKTGFLAAHKGDMSHIPEQIALASELSYFKHLHQDGSWVEKYKDPTVGATLFLGSVGNNRVLGRYLALYGFSELPLVVQNRFELSWKLGTGIGVTNKKYDAIFNPENIAIGSHVNMMVVLALKAKYSFHKNTLSAAMDITHFSNSAFQIPNLGINVPYVSFGFQRKLGILAKSNSRLAPKTFKKLRFGVLGMFSLKEIMPDGIKKYPIYAASLFGRTILSSKAGIEFGVDLLSNQSHFEFEPLVDKTQGSIVQLGVYVAYLVPLNHIHFVFGMGAYVRDWYNPNGLLYHRVGCRYQWFNGMFGHMAIKSHWAKADFLELGLGYVFNYDKKTR